MTSKLALVALLLFAGCNSGTRDPAGAGGSGGSTGAGGSGNTSVCGGALNGACQRKNASDCFEYAGLSAAQADPIERTCEEDNLGTWTAGGACNRSGAIGGCSTGEETLCRVQWAYDGVAADLMSDCADDMGTWITP